MHAPWIDAHVHLFPADTQDQSAAQKLPAAGHLHDVPTYLAATGAHKPAAVLSVHFSMAKTSEHVMASLDGLARAGIPARGIINADPTDTHTLHWAADPRVAGVRLYGRDSIPDFSADKPFWNALFNLLRHRNKQIVLFGMGEWLHKLIATLPEDLPLCIDHFGMPDAAKGTNDPHFSTLLAKLSARNRTAGSVWFKGPGYRSALLPQYMLPFAEAVLGELGESRLLLGASDAPFAGPVSGHAPLHVQGRKFNEVMDFPRVFAYLQELTERIAVRTQSDIANLAKQLLHDNAAACYGFEV